MEGAIVFASLVMGVAITDQLTSLHRLLRVRHRVRWDPLPMIFALMALMTVLMIWWALAGMGSGRITIGEFVPIMFELTLVFLLTSASLPDAGGEGATGGTDLRAFWDKERSYLWSLLFILVLFDHLGNFVTMEKSWAAWRYYLLNRSVDLVLTGALLAAVFVRRRWYDWTLIAVLAIGPIRWLNNALG
ncbi:hypothetical protein WJT74_07090 [Sphingomicrobium sp. XHP0239]|uniref:hypothetical protein n=1 Tax=Sphingomicrobium maritimum TaxID=3133972 RepID=UPI0031CC5F12